MRQIEDGVSFQLVQVCRAHRQRAEEVLEALDLHVGQDQILCRLWEKDGMPQSQLAEEIGVDLSTTTKAVQRMEKVGLLVRRQDSIDARVSRVYLTERGRATYEPVLQVWQELEERALQGLTSTEQVLLRRLLQHVATNLA